MKPVRQSALLAQEPGRNTLPQRFWGAVWIVLIVGIAFRSAVAQTNPNVRFLALEEVERQKKLGCLRQSLSAEENSHQERIRDISQISLQMRNLSDLPNDDQRVLACMRLRVYIKTTAGKVEEDRKKRLAISDTIRVMIKEKNVDDEVLTFLRQATALNQKLINETGKHEATLKKQFAWVSDYMKRVPPPKMYVNSTGIRMILVAAEGKPFYISTGPIPEWVFGKVSGSSDADNAMEEKDSPKTDLTRIQVTTFCKKLSVAESHPYVLPNRKQVEALHKLGAQPPIASWIADAWEWKDAEEQRMALRFGVKMAAIWNGAGVFGTNELIPEVPFAHYDSLGFFVATDCEAGILARMRRLKAYIK